MLSLIVTKIMARIRQGNFKKGCMFIGEFKFDSMYEGKLYELQQDNTYSLFQVKYDVESDVKNNINLTK